jgi:hypothetical protein
MYPLLTRCFEESTPEKKCSPALYQRLADARAIKAEKEQAKQLKKAEGDNRKYLSIGIDIGTTFSGDQNELSTEAH